jgi:hypothetical protein
MREPDPAGFRMHAVLPADIDSNHRPLLPMASSNEREKISE